MRYIIIGALILLAVVVVSTSGYAEQFPSMERFCEADAYAAVIEKNLLKDGTTPDQLRFLDNQKTEEAIEKYNMTPVQADFMREKSQNRLEFVFSYQSLSDEDMRNYVFNYCMDGSL